jgi:hypothetical protein
MRTTRPRMSAVCRLLCTLLLVCTLLASFAHAAIDHYKVLGVKKNASARDIKKACTSRTSPAPSRALAYVFGCS